MKKLILWILSILPLIITILIKPLLPNRIPMHYNFQGEVDRYGSSNEVVTFPIIIIVLSILWTLFILYYERKQKKAPDEKGSLEAKSNVKVLYIVAFCMTIIFTIMHFAIIISVSLDAKEATHIKLIDMNSLFNILLGLFLIIIGNFLPKTRKNSTVGIRTTWSMKNDETWSHSNRFAGKALVISGFIIVLTSAFTTAIIANSIMMISILVVTITSVVYSYHCAKMYS